MVHARSMMRTTINDNFDCLRNRNLHRRHSVIFLSITSVKLSLNALGSKLENINLHRLKCTRLLTNVALSGLKKKFTADVKGKFSLIVDERTDVSRLKQLCAIIRYHSEVAEKILDSVCRSCLCFSSLCGRDF